MYKMTCYYTISMITLILLFDASVWPALISVLPPYGIHDYGIAQCRMILIIVYRICETKYLESPVSNVERYLFAIRI